MQEAGKDENGWAKAGDSDKQQFAKNRGWATKEDRWYGYHESIIQSSFRHYLYRTVY